MADKTLDYTNFDFNTIKADIITLFQNDVIFRDYNFAGSNINTIIELISGVSDLFNFYINAKADDSFIRTAELYENVNKLVDLIGYNPPGYKASTLTIGLTTSVDFTNNNDYFEIPKWSNFDVSSVSPEGEVVNYTNPYKLAYISSAGINSFADEIYLIQGIKEDHPPFTGTGSAFQKIEITEDKAIEEYMEVTIDNEIWLYVDNLYRNVDSESKVFTTRYNKNEKVELSFGDGVFGAIPPLGSNIIVTYIKTLGEDGQIGANEITDLTATIKAKNNSTGIEYGADIDFTITQTNASDGGSIPLDANQVREYGPRSYRTQDRAVTTIDHNDLLISEFSEFIQEVVTMNTNDYYELNGITSSLSACEFNNLYLYILPRYGSKISGNLSQEILTFLEDYKMITANYIINTVDFKNVDVVVSFKSSKDILKTSAEITTEINALIRNFFQRSSLELGTELEYSTLLSQIRSDVSVSTATLKWKIDTDDDWSYSNLTFGALEFPELRNLTTSYDGEET